MADIILLVALAQGGCDEQHCLNSNSFPCLCQTVLEPVTWHSCFRIACFRITSGILAHRTLIKFNTHTHTHPFNGPFSGTTRVSRYQKGKTNLDFTEARDSQWQWHQLGLVQVCTLLQTDNHASTPPLKFLQARCPSCRPTNSVKALHSQ